MRKIRETSNHCFNCSSIVPSETETKHLSDSDVEMLCPQCGNTLIYGIIHQRELGRTIRQAPDSGDDDNFNEKCVVPDEVNWRECSIWWINGRVTAMIHGRYVAGSRILYNYVRKLREDT